MRPGDMASHDLEKEQNMPLPDFLKKFFWDYDFQKLMRPGDRDLIIGQILQVGDWRSIGWSREQIGDDDLKHWILKHRGRGLSPRQMRYWQVILDLPDEQVNQWMQAIAEAPWDTRVGQGNIIVDSFCLVFYPNRVYLND